MVIGRAKGSSKDHRRMVEGSSKDERQWLPAEFIALRPRMSFTYKSFEHNLSFEFTKPFPNINITYFNKMIA